MGSCDETIVRSRDTGELFLIFNNDSVFSNTFKSQFLVDGKIFNSVEQYYQYTNAVFFNDILRANLILNCDDPKECRRLGELVCNHVSSVWAKERFTVMHKGLMAKFEQSEQLRNEICAFIPEHFRFALAAGEGDITWGIGLPFGHENMHKRNTWIGNNLLGITLDFIRLKMVILKEMGCFV